MGVWTTNEAITDLTRFDDFTCRVISENESLPAGAQIRALIQNSYEAPSMWDDVCMWILFDASVDGGKSWLGYRALVREGSYLARLLELDYDQERW